MKTDIVSAVVAAIVGIFVAYLITANVIIKNPAPINVKTVTAPTSSAGEPSPEIFNYRALNPTVEVYIDCSNYDIDGTCLDGTGE